VIPEISRELRMVKDRFLHCSTDIWSTKKGEGVMGIRCHYIHENGNMDVWELRNMTIGMKKFNNRHTALNIRAKFEETLEGLKIDMSKVVDWIIRGS
jgi:hypothetical protein